MHPSRWSHRARLALWGGTFLALAVLNYTSALTALGARGIRDDGLHDARTAAIAIVGYALLGGIVLLATAGHSRLDVLALRRPRRMRRRALAPLVQVGSIAMLLALLSLAGVLSREVAQSEVLGSARSAPFVANAAVTALAGPFVEELLARGVGFWLLQRYGAWIAVGVTGVVFALAHGYVRDVQAFLLLGIGLSVLRAATDSIYPGLAFHIFQNAVAVVANR